MVKIFKKKCVTDPTMSLLGIYAKKMKSAAVKIIEPPAFQQFFNF